MKRVLAISGGVDSMVLLDFCVKKFGKEEIVVAHFNHGTRKSAETDEKFVEKKCRELGVDFFVGHEELGENISEEKAREKRYEFLGRVAEKFDGAKILTAHHLDDLIESVTINFLRGTGWRGLAVMNNEKIERPLIAWTKKDILKYAAENEIIFREDPTNNSEAYLRNRIRKNTRDLPIVTKKKLLKLRNRQIEVGLEIEEICREILPKSEKYPREIFKNVDDKIGIELLRFVLSGAKMSATLPQTLDFLNAIRNYNSGKKFNLPNDKLVKIDKKTFVI